MFQKQNYAIRSKNATPVSILRSWFRAQDIPVRTSAVPGFDLTVEGRLGGEVEVQVALRADETVPGEGVQVLGSDVTGRNPQRALAAYYSVLAVAGYDCIPPVDRGPEPKSNDKGNPRKLHYKDEPFLVGIRHTEFRRSPDPTPEQWSAYAEVMEKATWHFLRNSSFNELARRNGEDFHTLMTLARCWVTNFCARYEVPAEEVVWNDNQRKCYAFLVQRYNEYAKILRKKERSIHPDMETINIGLFGKPDADTEVSPDPEDDDEVDFDYVRAHCQLDVSTPKARRQSAADILSRLLSEMEHDPMVEVLKQTSVLERFDYDTRQEAQRQLKLHQSECATCVVSEGVAEEDEEAADLDEAGATE